MSNPLHDLAQSLLGARRSASVANRPSTHGFTLDVDEAYQVQFHQLSLLAEHGDTLAAIKLGLTDQAQRDSANWQSPSFGSLTRSMLLAPGEPLVVAEGIAPRVEPELVAVVGREITTPLSGRDDLLVALESIRLGIEVVDPRYPDSAFVLTDALADNASAFRGVISDAGVAPGSCDWAQEVVTLSVNGEPSLRGAGSALMGDPLVNVWQAINERLRLGQPVPQGLAIFSGNIAGKALRVSPGDQVVVSSPHLGELSLDVA